MPNILLDNEQNANSSTCQARTIALVGNPNSGKTTIFNRLTGSRQHIGNYPGVTVEKIEGIRKYNGTDLKITDLPGTYSLTAYSTEELVARNFIIEQRPEVLIDVLDASNLERNLYLAVQIMELGVPIILAMNMSDVARQRGIEFDYKLLRELLGVCVVETVGNKGRGMDELLAAAIEVADKKEVPEPLHINYGQDIENEISRLEDVINNSELDIKNIPSRWLAVKLLEGDEEVIKRLDNVELENLAKQASERLEIILGDSVEALIADRRYGFIAGACQEAVRSTVESRRSMSDKIDAIMTNRVLGLPIFLAMMYLVFQLTFTLGDPPMGWIEDGFGWLGEWVANLWPAGSESMLKSLLVDGIIGGVGGVLVFLPNILLLFLAIAILEDSGYMARAAFLMDRLMHKMGLHGKSFVPMLIGFGCSVPAIMATRTLENRRDRLVTMMIVPLMSCGARLPIYALIIPAFFPDSLEAPMLWLIYIIGIVLAVICARLLKSTILKGETPPFVMELPPYRMPTLRSIALHMYNRGGAYLKKAGTLILGVSIVLWAMQQWPGMPEQKIQEFDEQRMIINSSMIFPESVKAQQLLLIDNQEAEAALDASLMGRIGRGLEPLLKPCGFDWKISTSMIGAFAAKEVFVAQMGIVYSLGEGEGEESQPLRAKLQSAYTPLQGFCIMLFCLISAPCMATIAVTRREANSWKWALFQLGGLTALAWIVTTAVYQIGRLIT